MSRKAGANAPAFLFGVIGSAAAERIATLHCAALPPPLTFHSMIKLVDVYKSFGPKEVLAGFSLEVVEGETMVIIGYSGTGKSVAIKHIVGLLDPDAGEVWVDAHAVDPTTQCRRNTR